MRRPVQIADGRALPVLGSRIVYRTHRVGWVYASRMAPGRRHFAAKQ
jgi:hypothetical protein